MSRRHWKTHSRGSSEPSRQFPYQSLRPHSLGCRLQALECEFCPSSSMLFAMCEGRQAFGTDWPAR